MKAQGKRRVKGVQELVDNEKGEVLGSKKGAEGIPWKDYLEGVEKLRTVNSTKDVVKKVGNANESGYRKEKV